jgi:hypothetical protein
MRIELSIIALGSALLAQSAAAQQGQPNVQIVAQAVDRCMATYAVRLTKTAAEDEDIFAQASQGCLSLRGQLTAAINAQLPASQAGEILRTLEAQEKPNFMALLARIRSDRSQRAGG